jgi:uncharacterized protein DUF2800
MSHAPFAPSSAKRWMTCPGSFALSLQYPEEPDSEYAAEGSRLHEVAAGHLRTPSSNGTSKADYTFLKPYLDYARERILAADVWAVEEHIEHTTLLSGTPDLLLLFEKADMLEVVDLKCGAGIPVDPVENAQAMTYAYMALVKITEDTGRWPGHVRLTIVQPPISDKPLIWDTTADRIWEHGKAAEAAIKQAMAGGAPLVPGEHCRFCRARPSCPALRGEVIEALGVNPLPAVMSMRSLAAWLDRADRLDAWIAGLRDFGHKVAGLALAQGSPGIPGWGLKPKRATRQWADEEAVLAIARRRKIKIWQDKLMSPAMAEKAHPNMPEELTAQIVSVSSGTNLVRLTGDEPQAAKALESEAKPMDKLMTNFALLKFRK